MVTVPLNKIKPWSLRPHDEALGFSTNQFLDWVQTALNALIGQSIQVGQGLDALSKSSVDPTTGRILSLGSRPQSVSTSIRFVTTNTPTITFYWDGSNGSVPLKIWRDDGTIVGPIVAGSVLVVSGLAFSTTYFFYPFYDEASGRVVFAAVAGGVGSPPIAYIASTGLAAQQQLMRGHVPLSPNLAVTGVTTPASGGTGTSGDGGTGGGGGGGGGGRFPSLL